MRGAYHLNGDLLHLPLLLPPHRGRQEQERREGRGREKTFGWRDAPAYHRPLPRFRRGDFLLDGFPPEWADTDLLRQ